MLLELGIGEVQSVAQWDAQDRHRENREKLVAARHGDLNAQWELIVNHDQLIRSTIRRVVEDSSFRGNRNEVADSISRDAIVLVRSSFESFSGDYPQLSHWIRTIARHHALRQIKREQQSQSAAGYPVTDDVTGRSDHAAIVPSAADTFEASVDANERARLLASLERCLDALRHSKPGLHEVVWLQYKQGWSQQRIKARLEEHGDFIGVGAVGKRAEQGRKLLAACIRERMRHDQ